MGITKPPAFEHPIKRKRRATGEGSESSVRVEMQRIPEKKKSATRQRLNPPSNATETRMSVVVRLVVYPPDKGQIALYDDMIEAGFTPKTAILGLLKRGFRDFHAAVMTGSIRPSRIDAASGKFPIETTRQVSPEFVTRAKAIFDPFGVLSERSLGRTMGETIVATVGKDPGLN